MFGSTTVTALLTIIIGFAISWILRRRKDKSGLPPCLPALPLIGSLPFLWGTDRIHLCLTELTKRYGKVFAFYAASRYTVVISGYEALQEALIKRSADFAGREPVLVEQYATNIHAKGIIMKQYGEDFKRNRKISMSILKQYGYGMADDMKLRLNNIVSKFLNDESVRNGVAFEPTDRLKASMFEVMYSMIFGSDDHMEKSLKSIQRVIDTLETAANPILELFPILRFLPKYRKQFAEGAAMMKTMMDLLEKRINESSGYDHENFVKDFTIASSNEPKMKEELAYIIRDFIVASLETSSTLIAWILIFLANHRSVQKRLQEELDSVMSENSTVSMNDKSRLPFCEAVILETLRYKTVLPLALPHICLNDSSVGGCRILKNSLVLVNIWSAHMDPKVWSDPEEFRPERFLNEKGEVINRDLVIIFSLGKRSCTGELLGRQFLFHFVSSILHKYDVLPEEGADTVLFNESTERVIRPTDFKLRFLPRHRK